MRFNKCICKILQLSEFISKEKNSLSDHELQFWIQNNTVTISHVSILIWLPSNGWELLAALSTKVHQVKGTMLRLDTQGPILSSQQPYAQGIGIASPSFSTFLF